MHWLLALLLAGAAPFPVPPSRVSDTVRTQDGILLRVLAINDLHGALERQTWPWSGGRAVGGAPALKAWFDTLSRACHCTTLRLDGGAAGDPGQHRAAQRHRACFRGRRRRGEAGAAPGAGGGKLRDRRGARGSFLRRRR